jgi:hypothetical protein
MVVIENKKAFSQKFYNKLRDYRRVDKHKKETFPIENEGLKTINLKEAIQMVHDLATVTCHGCNCNILFCDYEPYCVYQFSFDRIDNKRIHSKDNLKIVCWNCNSSGYGSIKLSCSTNCHINATNLQDRPFYRETSTMTKS